MKNQTLKLYFLTFLLLADFALFAHQNNAQKPKQNWQPNIPKTWVDAEMEELEVPLTDPVGSPKHVSTEYYYRIPARKIYKSYPVYAPDKEPFGYLDWLKQREPEIVFEAAKLKTEADWVKAGELVFDADIGFSVVTPDSYIRHSALYEKTGMPVTKAGINPFLRYVVREKGKVELGVGACAVCHTRLMPDGTVVKGAQGNIPFGRWAAFIQAPISTLERIRRLERSNFGTPWIKPDPQARLEQMTIEEYLGRRAAWPAGVQGRQGTSSLYPVQVPDLIGIKDRKYLDRTGLERHRSLVDLMRYAAINQDTNLLASYAGFVPDATDSRTLPEPAQRARYSDEQLYALSLFLYSLKPPPNPNKFDALAKHGQKVFQSEGCASCHTPPLYTNNKLTPVDGFTVPEEHKRKYDILPLSVGTDPNLALRTRRGTGYYKVPSLKGVWYRGPFEHNGSVATLEDWFDPKRLKDDYVPTGFKGYGVKTRAVKGHEFGLELSAEDKRALIAFLKTL